MEDKNPKAFAFVLMPLDERFDDIYEFGIKQACRDAGVLCERVDEQIFNESILTRIYDQIAKADIIIAEMTGRNANVFYETGYAHALNKQVILLTQRADDIPFDLKHHPHIVYGGKITSLKLSVEKRVRQCIENLKLPPPPLSNSHFELPGSLEFFVNDAPLKESPQINLKDRDYVYSLKVSILNVGEFLIKGEILMSPLRFLVKSSRTMELGVSLKCRTAALSATCRSSRFFLASGEISSLISSSLTLTQEMAVETYLWRRSR